MTSIISLFLLCICALLSRLRRCHLLFLPVSYHLPLNRLLSAFTSYFFLFLCHSFNRFHHAFFQFTCLFSISLSTTDLCFPLVLLIQSKSPSHLLASPPILPACLSCHYLLYAVCISSSRSGWIQAVKGHLLSDLTGLNVAVTLAVTTGTGKVQCLALAGQPDSQTCSQLSHWVYEQSDCSFAGIWQLKMDCGLVQGWG